jgi:hypothetical protein
MSFCEPVGAEKIEILSARPPAPPAEPDPAGPTLDGDLVKKGSDRALRSALAGHRLESDKHIARQTPFSSLITSGRIAAIAALNPDQAIGGHIAFACVQTVDDDRGNCATGPSDRFCGDCPHRRFLLEA